MNVRTLSFSCSLAIMALISSATPSTSLADPPPEVCTGDQYIGVAPNPASCSGSIDGWKRTKLFGSGLPAELSRYCLVTKDRLIPAPKVSDLPNWGVDSPKLDCQVVVPHAADFEAENRAALETSFRSQVESLDPLPAALVSAPPTNVLVVDSSRPVGFPLPSEGLIDHGKFVGMVSRQLACPNGSPVCAAVVASTLALPLYVDPLSGVVVRDPNGGKFGSLGDISKAIWSAAQEAAAQPGPDIINLSIGWMPSVGGNYVGTNWLSLSPPIRAVHAALSYASCHGALIIAAAGNTEGGPNEQPGAIYPAAWEGKPAPDGARCSALNATPPSPPITTSYKRLVYAVAGVDPRDAVLASARPGSLPPLVASADHATISSNNEITSIFTGSSVAAAVTSAAAALAWRYDTQLRNHEVMALLRGVFDPVPGLTVEIPRDGCSGGACPTDVRRVSLCKAVAAACDGGANCATPTCPGPITPRDVRPTDLTYTLDGTEVVAIQPAVSDQGPAGGVCEGDYWSSSPGNICPADTYSNSYARPLSGPHGGKVVCSACSYRLTSVYLDIAQEFGGGVLSQPTLVIKSTGGEDPKIIPLTIDQGALDEPRTIVVEGLPFDATTVEKATIDFKVDFGNGAYSSSDVLIIEP